ncbi:unnamed protein product [Ixodes hexagonus]
MSVSKLVEIESVLACLCILSFASAALSGTPVAYTASGLVAGNRLTLSENEVDVFSGIPYALPPLGDLRFRKPIPVASWNGTYNATSQPTPCVQLYVGLSEAASVNYTDTSEDCLYLNIWRPSSVCNGSLKCRARLPVVVFIHGGAFQWGDSSLPAYDGSNLVATCDVVFVSFNYRLGFFGFLSLGTPELPGNVGLWDQTLALKWVHDNIVYFGGASEDVTLWGHSAGAASAGFHAVSPHSKGLFGKLILQSGTPLLTILTVSHKRVARFLEISNALGCYNFSREWMSQVPDMIDCLRKVDAREIVKQIRSDSPINRFYPPGHGDEFLPDDPLADDTWEKLNTKSMFAGYTLNEGTLVVRYLRQVVPQLNNLQDNDYRFAMTIALSVLLNIPVSAGRKIITAYFGDYDIVHDDETVFAIMAEAIGDAVFKCPADLLTLKASDQGKGAYKYVFAHRPSFSPWPSDVGVSHADDLPFMLGSLVTLGGVQKQSDPVTGQSANVLNYSKYSPQELNFTNDLLHMLSSFVKTGWVLQHS